MAAHSGPRHETAREPAHSHDHAHDHAPGHGHAHGHGHGGTSASLSVALCITLAFAVVEVLGGRWSGSLALISDAGHMVTDAAALGLALLAQRIAKRPPSERASFGYARAEVLGAFVNALVMLGVVIWIVIEAVERLRNPNAVAGAAVVAVAVVGLLVNLFVAWLLARDAHSLNHRAALLHVLGDLLGSVAAILAGAVVMATGWLPIDPLLSVAVAVLILNSTWKLLRQATEVLMEAVPRHLSYDEVGQALSKEEGVISVHDLHIWTMHGDRVSLSAHLLIDEPASWPLVLARCRRMLRARYRIDHVTLQPSWASAPPVGKKVIALAIKGEATEKHLH